jgi:hypothetical protein
VPPLISVVVPAYRAADTLPRLAASLDRQTLDRDAFEVVVVDDGSPDDTLQTARELGARRASWTVTSIPASGWPGRPRNVGTDLASGAYVLYLDSDDEVPPDGLRAWAEFALATGSDVCLGKEVRPGSWSPGLRIFRADVARAGVARHHLMDLGTPHKLYRRQFLLDHGIRFAEGRQRLEDHELNVRAYARAGTISVLASAPTYLWHRRAGSTSKQFGRELGPYFGRLLDLIRLAQAEPLDPADQDEILLSWLTGKVLRRLSAPGYLRWSPRLREAALPHLQRVADAVPERLDGRLDCVTRERLRLLRDGDAPALLALATEEAGRRTLVTVRHAGRRGAALDLELSAWLSDRWGRPVVLAGADRDGRGIAAGEVDADVVLADLRTGVQWPLPVPARPEPAAMTSVRPRARFRVRLDPATAAAGQALGAGEWHVRLKPRWFADHGSYPVPALAVPGRSRPGGVALTARRGRLTVRVPSSAGGPPRRPAVLPVPLIVQRAAVAWSGRRAGG